MDIGASPCGSGASANAFSKLCGTIFTLADAQKSVANGGVGDQVICGKYNTTMVPLILTQHL